MKVFAIGDLHLSVNNPKPMDIFGPQWEGYVDKIFDDWKQKVASEDLVLLPGDFSWAMKLEQAQADFDLIKDLPGKKVLIRGNHDYWWASISTLRKVLPKDVFAIQNDAIDFGEYVVCGTRGWTVPERNGGLSMEDQKIFNRELIRLELSLQSAKKMQTNGQKLICMIHFPPCNYSHDDSEFTKLFEKYAVDCVVFGHLHGLRRTETSFCKNNIKYFLVSCDLVENQLVEIDV